MENISKGSETPGVGKRKYLSIQTLARRWNVSDSTIRRLIEEGELKGMKIRRTCKILADSVQEFESRSSF